MLSNKSDSSGICRLPFVKTITFKSFNNEFFKNVCLFSIVVLLAVLGAIIYFISKNGLLTFNDITLKDVFLSISWSPQQSEFGIIGLIWGTLALTMLSLGIAFPLSLILAIFIAEYAPKQLKNIINHSLDLLVGIPSIVYGYLGLTLLLPLLRELSGHNVGDGLMAAALVLSIMVLPTITRISADAISSVPQDYRNVAFALGANKSQVLIHTVLPAARNGLTTAGILGIVRAVGETMAVVMVIGNTAQLATSVFLPTSVLTSNIVMQITNVPANGVWSHVLYLQALVLLFISLFLIIIIRLINRRTYK